MRFRDIIETATSGATSAGNIASVPNPHLSPGPARGKKSYTGSPGRSGTKAPPQPKPKTQKPSDNALDMKGVSVFGAPIKRVSENNEPYKQNKKLKESISYETTIRAIINELESIRQLYVSLHAMADNWFNKFGTLKNGFHRNAAGRKKIWFENFYFGKMSRELHDLSRYVSKEGAVNAEKNIKEILSNLTPSTVIIDIIQITMLAGNTLKEQRLVNFSKSLSKIYSEYDDLISDLDAKSDEDEDEQIQKPKKSNVAGQQNAQVEVIVNNILQELPANVRGEIRNAIARSPNKLQALQQELTRRNINLNTPRSESTNWYNTNDDVDQITEDLKKWFRGEWIRSNSNGKIQNKKSTSGEPLGELKCWSGYRRVKGIPAGAPGSCKKKTKESAHKCPNCGGELVSEEMVNEKKDACYYKVKSQYKVWPSAYAGGALVRCRKKGAKNWGSKK
jgi:hypothetical protein